MPASDGRLRLQVVRQRCGDDDAPTGSGGGGDEPTNGVDDDATRTIATAARRNSAHMLDFDES